MKCLIRHKVNSVIILVVGGYRMLSMKPACNYVVKSERCRQAKVDDGKFFLGKRRQRQPSTNHVGLCV